jgi:membrane-associated phospholipid phosphatase
MKLGLACTALAAAGLAGATARAEGDTGPAYRLSLEVDAPIILIGAASASSYLLMSETVGPACAPRCDPARVNAFDRWAAGRYSVAWQKVGDVATVSTLVLVPSALLIDRGVRRGLTDLLVVAEAVLATAAIQVPISYAVARPRPRLYGDAAPLDERTGANAARSFFSGHVANCVAATVATTRALRRRRSPALAWTALAVGAAGSALVGVGRVGAGSHFPSDVLIGAAVGVGVGIAVPALHEGGVGVAPMPSPDGGGGLALAGVFQ